MRYEVLVSLLFCCLLFCGCTDQAGREAPRAAGLVAGPSPSPAETLVVDLRIGANPDPGATGRAFPSPPVMNDGNPLTLAINAATVRTKDASIGVPETTESKLLVLNVTIRNVKADPYDFRQSSIRIVDSDNREVRPFSGRIPGEQELGDGQILHDRSRSGTIAFEVPPRADRHYMIVIHDDRTRESMCISLFQATE